MSFQMKSTGGLDVVSILPSVEESKNGDSLIYVGGQSLFPELMIFDGINKKWNPYGGVGLTDEQKAKVDALEDVSKLLYLDNLIQGIGITLTKNLTTNEVTISLAENTQADIDAINAEIDAMFL